MRPRLLDLFCGAGGAAMGYHRAGFDVVGVDIEPQPHYPFEFHQANALAFPLDGFDAVHASPPCQRYSAMSSCRPGLSGSYPNLVEPVRVLLMTADVPWVIENVVGADLRDPVLLCGQMFDLPLYRHRLFEASWPLALALHPPHGQLGSAAGHWKPGRIVSVSGNCAPIALARQAMGVDWMTRAELAEAIPPAYTQWIGEQLLAHLKVEAA